MCIHIYIYIYIYIICYIRIKLRERSHRVPRFWRHPQMPIRHARTSVATHESVARQRNKHVRDPEGIRVKSVRMA